MKYGIQYGSNLWALKVKPPKLNVGNPARKKTETLFQIISHSFPFFLYSPSTIFPFRFSRESSSNFEVSLGSEGDMW